MLEIGEYFRTKDGCIGRITEDFGKDPCFRNINYYRTDILYTMPGCYASYNIYEDMIVKHSKNIIDLIEVGDYVNGSEVLDKHIPRDVWEPIELRINDRYTSFLINEDIKTILTKEQYEANIYKIN